MACRADSGSITPCPAQCLHLKPAGALCPRANQGRAGRALRRDSTKIIASGIAALLLWGSFVAVRWVREGGPETFVVAGRLFVTRTDIPVVPGHGYDGQFFFRLALDPFTGERTAHGITLDVPAYRAQRVLYPALAWALSGGGRPGLVPWMLLGLNLAAVAAVGALGAAWALGERKPAWHGAIIAAWPGFAASIGRDTPEPMAVAFLLAALIAIRARRPVPATIALCCAVLTRETTLVLIAGLAFVAVIRKPATRWWVWIWPTVVFTAWQAALGVRWDGQIPLIERSTTSAPLAAPISWLVRHFARGEWLRGTLTATVLATLAVLVVAALRGRPPMYLLVAFLASAILLATRDHFIWMFVDGSVRVSAEATALGLTAALAGRNPNTPIYVSENRPKEIA